MALVGKLFAGCKTVGMDFFVVSLALQFLRAAFGYYLPYGCK